MKKFFIAFPVVMIVAYFFAAITATDGVADDILGIFGLPYRAAEPSLSQRIFLEWTEPTYVVASGGGSTNRAPWGPLAATLHDVVAAYFGRTNIVPFRILSVGVFSVLVMATFLTTRRATRSKDIALFAAAVIAVHPLGADTVPWASDLFDLLGATMVMIGMYLLLGCASPGRALLVGLVATLLVGFSKPTVTPNMLYAIALLALVRRPVALLIGSTVGIVAGMLMHQVFYRLVVGGSFIGEAIAVTFSDSAHVRTFMEQLCVQIAQGWTTFGPRTSRLVYAHETWTSFVAGTTIVVICGGLGLVGAMVWHKGWSKRAAVFALIIFCIYVAGNIPGALYAMRQRGIGVRYCFVPFMAAVPLAAVWGSQLETFGISERIRRVFRWGPHVAVCLCASWMMASLDRLPRWQSEADNLEEEIRLNAEWQVSGEADPEYVAFANFLRILAIEQGRAQRGEHICGHLALLETASAQMAQRGTYIYVPNDLQGVRRGAWNYALSDGFCHRLKPGMRKRLASIGVQLP